MVMDKVKLTKRVVDAAQVTEKRYVIWDSDVKGFGLRVAPSGRKTYALKTRVRGEQRWMDIGVHGSPWTAETARERAKELLREVASGGDPAADKKAAKAMPAMAELCDLYLAEGVAHKKASTVHADRGRIEHHIKPRLGKKKVDEITKADCERLFITVRDIKTPIVKEGAKKQGRIIVKGGEGVAKQCVMLLSTLMTFAVDRGYRADNPAKGVKKPKGKTMQRFLSEAEIASLGDALAHEVQATDDPYPAAAIKLLAFTGCRRGEIERLEWRHVDIERRQLRLPDSKTGSKTIYLNAPALALLEQLAGFAGENPFVVAGRLPGKPFNGMGKVWDRVRKRAGLVDVRMHDLRHSFASVGVGGNLGLPVIGALLGHRNTVTTQKYAHLADHPVRAANEAIGAKIATAMSGAKAR